MPVLWLHFSPQPLRAELYKMAYDDNNIVLIANLRLVGIGDLSKIIWPNDANYRRVIRTKALKETEKDEIYRSAGLADALFVDVDVVQRKLTEWSHRDAAARRQLAAFDFDAFRARVNSVRRETLQTVADRHAAEANEHLAKRQRILEEIAQL